MTTQVSKGQRSVAFGISIDKDIADRCTTEARVLKLSRSELIEAFIQDGLAKIDNARAQDQVRVIRKGIDYSLFRPLIRKTHNCPVCGALIREYDLRGWASHLESHLKQT